MSAAADAVIDRAMALVSDSFITATGPGGQNVNMVCDPPPRTEIK